MAAGFYRQTFKYIAKEEWILWNINIAGARFTSTILHIIYIVMGRWLCLPKGNRQLARIFSCFFMWFMQGRRGAAF
jgi:hypothetical protein